MLLFVCKSLIFKDWQIKSGMARIWLWIFQETSRVRRASYFLSSQGRCGRWTHDEFRRIVVFRPGGQACCRRFSGLNLLVSNLKAWLFCVVAQMGQRCGGARLMSFLTVRAGHCVMNGNVAARFRHSTPDGG